MDDLVKSIMDSGVVAIMRAKTSVQLLEAAKAIMAGGVNVIEVTMTTSGALDFIRDAVRSLKGEVVLGAGSVLDPETARAVIMVGAQFVVCPTLNLRTIEMCRRYSIPVIPGAYTPTEVLTAWEAGATFVKVFPASAGGPAYIKSLKAPLPQVKLVAVGGVDLGNTADFIRSGCDAVGVGGELVNQYLLDSGDFNSITQRASNFRAEVERGRS